MNEIPHPGFDKPEEYETFTTTNDLEEAADNYAVNTASYYYEDEDDEVHSNIDELKPAFIAGAKWLKNALLKWAKETYLNENASAIRKVCYKQLVNKLNSL